MRDRHSAYAYPRRIEFVDELPKTLTGKIRRIELREREQQQRVTRFARPAVMGVLNMTPDSFSDGGEFLDPGAARGARSRAWRRRERTWSTSVVSRRGPGRSPSSADEELRRVLPVIEALAAAGDVPVSIDTSKAAVARAAADGRRGVRQRRDRAAR